MADMPIVGVRTCRGCGCTDVRACVGGCTWALFDVDELTGVCSTCAEELGFHPMLLARVGIDFDLEDAGAVLAEMAA